MTKVMSLDKVLEEMPKDKALGLMQNLRTFWEREELAEQLPHIDPSSIFLEQRWGENALHGESPVFYGGPLAKIALDGESGFYEHYLLVLPQRGIIVPEKNHFRILPDKELSNIILVDDELVDVLSGTLCIMGEDVKGVKVLPAGARQLSYSCILRYDGSIGLFQNRHALHALQNGTGMVFSRLMIPYSVFKEDVNLDLHSEQIDELEKRSKELYGVELLKTKTYI